MQHICAIINNSITSCTDCFSKTFRGPLLGIFNNDQASYKMNERKIRELVSDFFTDDISQFTVSILGPDITYRGKAYCWASGCDLVFFNADLKHLQTVAVAAIIRIEAGRPDECLLNTNCLRIKLKRASF